MTVAAVFILALTLAVWAYIFVLPRPGIWVRSSTAAGVLVVVSTFALWRAGELGEAVGSNSPMAVLVGVVVGVAWLVATQVGYRVLSRLLPSFIQQVHDLYSIARGDRTTDVAAAVVVMAIAEEFVFRLVVQREFGIVIGVIAYAAAQTVERNWALTLAGAACGIVWGLLYAWQDNLAAPLVAHLIWTGTLTFVWPLPGCNGHSVPGAADVGVTEV